MVEPEISFHLLAFGQLAERIGQRSTTQRVSSGTTIREFVTSSELEQWIDFGLSVAKNGQRCSLDEYIQEGDEIALLPPMSGG